MNTKILLFTITMIVFQGCSSKQLATPNKSIDINTSSIPSIENNISNASEFEDDEFSDEYDDENKEDIIDPLSGYNHFMTSFNDTLFIYILNPTSEAYATVFPEILRSGISNFVHNIQFPIRFTNNLLQAKFKNTTEETERFIINSTLGLGGLFDLASTYFEIEAHNEDFGQTLGFYGIGAGFHIVLPLLGPSNVRDVVGLLVDSYASPIVYQDSLTKYKIPKNYLESAGIYGLQTINKSSLNLGAYEILKKDAIDLYPFLREFYEKKRLSDIKE